MPDISFTIGIKNYEIEVLSACEHAARCLSKLTISFELNGDFMQAALSDNIGYTIDYDQLAQKLAAYIQESPSTNKEIKKIGSFIKNFSTIINAGFLELELRCSHIYLKDRYII